MAISPLIGSHILLALSTYIIGETPFPEYSVVVMMDDIQLFYYDSNMTKLIYRNYKSDHEEEEKRDASFIFREDYESLQKRALIAQEQINISHGIQVLQRLSKCELFDDETEGPVMVRDAFEGVTEEVVNFTTQNNTLSFESRGLWKSLWNDEDKRVHYEKMYAHYSQVCFKTLKNALYARRNETKVKPSVACFQKTLGRGTKVTCLATGFYPRHTNLTLLKDGKPVSDHQITGGELLPNGDGTYQMRKSLEVSAEEVEEKHSYTCAVDHILENCTIDLGLSMMAVGLSCVVVLICVAGAITACFIHRKKQRVGKQRAQDRPSSDQSEMPLRRLESSGAVEN